MKGNPTTLPAPKGRFATAFSHALAACGRMVSSLYCAAASRVIPHRIAQLFLKELF